MNRPSRRRNSSKAWSRVRPHAVKIALALAATAALGAGAYHLTRQSPADHLQQGLALYQAGDTEAAAIALKNALQAMPDHAQARFTLGRIHFAGNDFQAADKEFTRARAAGLAEVELLALHGRTLLILGEPARLLAELTVPQAADAATQATVHALRARAHLMLEDPAAAEASLAQAEALAPGLPEVLVSRALHALADGRRDSALPLLAQALAQAPERADIWLLQGDLQRSLGLPPAAALASYGQAVAAEPGNPRARLARAQLHLDQDALELARADVQAALELSPQDVIGRYFMAYLEFRGNRLAEANTRLQELLRGAPDFIPAHLLAGAVNVGLGHREAARAHLDRVLAVAPQHGLARKLKAATLADLGDLETARQLLAGFGSDADDPVLHLLQGQIALRQGRYREALRHLDRAPQAVQQDARFLTDLATGMMGSGDRAGAIAALTQAAELDTQSARPELLLVLAHLQAQRYDQAMQVVERLAQERPDDPFVHNLRASILLTQNRPDQARPHLARALALQADYYPAAYNLALLDLQRRDLPAARGRMQQVLQANPREARAWLMLARLDALAGRPAEALRNLEQARRANDRDPQVRVALIRHWLEHNQPGKALTEARNALDVTGRADFLEFIGLAQAALNDPASARASYARWAELQPGNPAAHFRLAQAQGAMQDHAGALVSLDRALTLRPDLTLASVGKALTLARLNRAEEGIALARSIQARQPQSAAGFLAEADILAGQQRFAAAAPLYARAATLDRRSESVQRVLDSYTRAGQAAAGQQWVTQWLAGNPADHGARHALALSLLQARQWQDAAAHYRQLARARPGDLVAHNNLAWVLGELKHPDAIATAEQALKLDPQNPVVMDTLGWILVNSGQMARGLALLEQAHAKAPTAADIHWHYAAALARSGNTARARQELEKLIYSGNDFPARDEARRLLASL